MFYITIRWLIGIQTLHLVVSSPSGNYYIKDGLHSPCPFSDTVNITGDVQLANGSYLHDDLVIPLELVSTFDYVYKDMTTYISVEPHLRACVCKLRTCINMCCQWGTAFNVNSSTCVETPDDKEWPEPLLNVTMNDHTVRMTDITKQFVLQNFRPCEIMYSLVPETNEDDAWIIFENGTMLRTFDQRYLKKEEFCLVPTLPNETDFVYVINPANCNILSEFSAMKIISAWVMMFSVPFMIITIVVYLAVPDLRNCHGKSLVCYLAGLIIGYSMLSYISLRSSLSSGSISCKLVGYMAYYSFMAAFFWLSVISFDLWHNFRGVPGINRFDEKRRFIVYSMYAWGLPLLLLTCTALVQEMLDLPMYLKPGIGGDYCWFDMNTWAPMIYFYSPILIIIVLNSIMFVMTAVKIHCVQKEITRMIAQKDSSRNLSSEKARFGLFLRLFIVMGVTWSMEILSYFFGPNLWWTRVFYVTDICNAVQGFLIFVLFVMKKKVKNSIMNRCLKRRPSSACQTNSTNSGHSDVNHSPDKYAMNITGRIAPVNESL